MPVTNKSTNAHVLAAEKLEELNARLSSLEVRRGYIDFGGQFLLDPNEINGFGVMGPFDDSNTQDLGDVGTEPTQVAGGWHRPFDFKVTRLSGWIRESNNDAVDPWGFLLFRQKKTDGSNDRVNTKILAEVAENNGVGPRSYDGTQPFWFSVDLSSRPNNIVEVGEILGFGVEAPTAMLTNRHVQFMSGLIEFERV